MTGDRSIEFSSHFHGSPRPDPIDAIAINGAVMKTLGAFVVVICMIFVVALPRQVHAAPAEAGTIHISYAPPKNPAHQTLYELLKEYRALERLQELLSRFRLPRPLTLKLEGCDGESNAWYDDDTVTVCYEYMDEVWRNAPETTTPSGLTPIDALLGPLFDVFFHETAHALFDMLKVPVLGGEEDAADQVSAYLMLQFGKAEARRLILGTAHAYRSEFQSTTANITLIIAGLVLIAVGALFRTLRWWIIGSGATLAMSAAVYFALTSHYVTRQQHAGEHGTPAQRFYNLLCIAYGADAQLFADLVQKGYLPKERAEGCAEEYQQVVYAFQMLIGPHIDQSLSGNGSSNNLLPDRKNSAPASASIGTNEVT